ncbi:MULTISPECIES: hypothetical protein [unclassified Tolypothrix]|nr:MULTISPECIES: hypothetical protein [unclassified Tolypothrix]
MYTPHFSQSAWTDRYIVTVKIAIAPNHPIKTPCDHIGWHFNPWP